MIGSVVVAVWQLLIIAGVSAVPALTLGPLGDRVRTVPAGYCRRIPQRPSTTTLCRLMNDRGASRLDSRSTAAAACGLSARGVWDVRHCPRRGIRSTLKSKAST